MSAVTAWTGSIGGYVLSQSDAGSKPLYSTGSSFDAKINGSPTITFNPPNTSSGDWLTIHGSNAITEMWATADLTILSFMRFAGIDERQRVFSNYNPHTTDFLYDEVTNNFELEGAAAGVPSLTPFSGSSMVFSQRAYGVGNDVGFTVNTSSSYVAGAVARDHDKFNIGARGQDPSTQFFSGSISELMIFTGALNDVAVEGYKRHVLKNYLNPENISGLTHRWKPSDATRNPSSGIATVWEDCISKVSLESSGSPFFVHTGSRKGTTTNYRSYISASNISGFETGASPISESFGNGFTVFFVVEKELSGSDERIFDLFDPGDDATPQDRFQLYFNTSNTLVLNTTEAGASTDMSGTFVRLSGSTIGGVSYAGGGNSKTFINGRIESISTTERNPRITTTGSFKLMNRIGGDNSTKRLYEFMIFNRALTEAEILNLTSYARLRFGIYD